MARQGVAGARAARIALVLLLICVSEICAEEHEPATRAHAARLRFSPCDYHSVYSFSGSRDFMLNAITVRFMLPELWTRLSVSLIKTYVVDADDTTMLYIGSWPVTVDISPFDGSGWLLPSLYAEGVFMVASADLHPDAAGAYAYRSFFDAGLSLRVALLRTSDGTGLHALVRVGYSAIRARPYASVGLDWTDEGVGLFARL